jgi:hypothetical protein
VENAVDWKSLEVETQEGADRFVVARPSLIVGLIGGQELLASAPRMLDFWLQMRQSESALFGLGSNARSFRAMSSKALSKLRTNLASAGSLGYFMLKDAPGFDIGSCSLQFSFGNDEGAGEQATVSMAFPPTRGEAPNCDATAETVLEFFHDVRPQQAFASLGFSLVFGREYEAVALPKLFAFGKRFSGLDLPERFTEVRIGNRLKSAYWITGARADLLRAHGVIPGSQAIHNTNVKVRQSEGFITFRAGDCPPLGDRNRNAPDFSTVKSLHNVLRPALLERWASSNVFGFGVEDIDSWFSRFDT